MSESNMFIFVWNAVTETPARSEVFHNQEDAWANIRDTRVRNWPHFIIEINGDPMDNSNVVFKPIEFVQQMMG